MKRIKKKKSDSLRKRAFRGRYFVIPRRSADVNNTSILQQIFSSECGGHRSQGRVALGCRDATVRCIIS